MSVSNKQEEIQLTVKFYSINIKKCGGEESFVCNLDIVSKNQAYPVFCPRKTFVSTDIISSV